MDLEKPDYSIFTYFDVWTLEDAFNIIVSECECRSGLHDKHGFIESVANDRRYEITHFLQDNHRSYTDEVVYSKLYYLIGDKLRTKKDFSISRHIDLDKTEINIKRFIKFAVWEKLPFPEELVNVFLRKDVHKQSGPAVVPNNEGREQLDLNSEYEDIISDESILKLKGLPPHLMKQQVAMLAAEKKKSDAAVIAAAKIGLLFFEGGLPKPATKDLFIAEYKQHLDKLPPLQKTTIERIYKHLPDGYRRTTDGGKVAGEQYDIDAIIKAATFAGYQYGSKDIANVDNFVKALNRESYPIPDEKVLSKIIALAGKLE